MIKMKDSGVEWIGDIPVDWETTAIKNYCINVFAGGTPQSNNSEYWDGDIPWIPSGSCHDCKISSAPKFITKEGFENSSTKLIPANTALVAMTGATCGNTGYLTFDSCANQSVTAYVAKSSTYSLFIWYLLQAVKEHLLTFQTGGAQGGVNVNNCKNIVVPYISFDKQKKIADYLDEKCSKIDEIIEKQQTVIEKLKEYKLSVITEAVTKGLNPDVEMKYSGIDWIGAIPEHWNIAKISRIATVVRGASPRPAGDPKYFNGHDVPWITVAEVTKGEGKYIYETKEYLTFAGAEKSRLVEAGTLLLSNSGATLGVPKITTITGCINDGSVAFYNLDVNQLFLLYVFKSRTYELRKQMAGYGQPNLNTDIIKSISMPIPSDDEQIDIVEYLDSKCTAIDTTIEKRCSIIDKLVEYKKSLIYEVVTGKKEV